MEWEAIETAPKDGTPILGFAEEETTTVFWLREGECWCLCVSGAFAEDGEWTPTHWQPLPERPRKGHINDKDNVRA